jgi:hypothetical protein
MDPLFGLVDIPWPWHLGDDELLAWAREHAPQYVYTEERAQRNRASRLRTQAEIAERRQRRAERRRPATRNNPH